MQQEITYNDLRAFEMDIYQQSASPAFRFFFSEKIKRFMQLNSIRLKAMHETMDGLINKYVLHGDEGPVTVEKEGKRVYQFIDEESEKEYTVKAEEFLSRTIKLQI